jgi:uncharacterized repeat protein (TIGR03803 family)
MMVAALWLSASGSLPAQIFTTLYKFSSGGPPTAGLVEGTDGNLYGTTGSGENSACGYSGGCGTMFKITTTGTLTTLHIFDYTDGANPSAALIQASDGNFYGTTGGGGNCTNFADGCGTVFKITPTGTLTTLHSFDRADGAVPTTLVQHSNGTFYGTTVRGGANVYHASEGGVARFSVWLLVWARLWRQSLPLATWVGHQYSRHQSNRGHQRQL